MTSSKKHKIIILDPDANFREKMYNFLLISGYEHIHQVEYFDEALAKKVMSGHDVIILDATLSFDKALDYSKRIFELNPKIKVILMIGGEEKKQWDKSGERVEGMQFLIKTMFQRNILSLLEDPV
jgi:two-component SAPR family response regulator